MIATSWCIEKIVPGGAGMARLADGRIGFAHGALPGEELRIQDAQEYKSYVVARSFQVVVPASARREPPCALAGAGCGCDLLHAEYSAQLEYKAAILEDALRRVGKFSSLPPMQVCASPHELGYRSRIRLHIDELGRVGYHQRGTHHLLQVTSCPVAQPDLSRALARFSELAREHNGGAGEFEGAELRLAPSENTPSAWLVPRERVRPTSSRAKAFERALAREFHVVVGDEPDPALRRWPTASGFSLLVPIRGFVQVNWEVNLLLIRELVLGATERQVRTFLDVYAGAGNFTLALLSAGLAGTGIESNADAVQAAAQSLGEIGLPAERLVLGDALRTLREMSAPSELDLVVLDPPRAGAASLLPELLRLRPRYLAYCSCDPVTLARDLRALTAGGYTLQGVRGFDMFPGTHHVEALAWMERSEHQDLARDAAAPDNSG